MNSFPPRIHVLLARDAKVGVVLRRGPSKTVCSVLWNRKTDEFRVGQWLRGRIYERRSDLSPDGKYMIYFAISGRWRSETEGSWTAISRVSWLKAIVLLPKGDCWNGGGLFTGTDTYWLNDNFCRHFLHDSKLVRRDCKFQPEMSYGAECRAVYFPRLQRDGWVLKKGASTAESKVFEKALTHGWLLRKYAHAEIGAPPGKGCYWDEHELEHAESGRRIDGAAWEWAELDGKRLVWAERGCLFTASIKGSCLGERKLLHDFNDMKFEALTAPY